jgi:hypothetical protein
MAAEVVLKILGDERDLLRAFNKSSRGAKGFQKDMDRTFRGTLAGSGAFRSLGQSIAFASTTFLGAAGFTAAVRKSISSASDLTEEISKSEVLFGSSASTIRAWSETTASSIGVAQAEALRAAGNFGAMFETIGLGDRVSAGMSQRLVQLGADMASFNNEDPTEMLDRLRAGLAGEAEPLRRFGVLLSEARVQAEAYAAGIAEQGAKLTEQQKVQARYNLILKDSSVQQGDFARTSEGLANQQRILRAQITTVAASLGAVLLPKITAITQSITDWLSEADNVARLRSGFQTFTDTIGSIATTVDGIAQAFGGWADTLTILVGAWVGFQAVGVASSVAVMTSHIVAATAVRTAWQAALIATGFGALAVAAGIAAAYVVTHWTKVKDFFRGFVDGMVGTFRGMWEIIQGLAKTAVGGMLTTLTGFVRGALELLAKIPSPMQDEVQSALEGLESFTTDWVEQGQNQMVEGGRIMGEAWANAFTTEVENGLGTAAALAESLALKNRPRVPAELEGGGDGGGGGGTGGVTPQQRNTWFDQRITRMIDRVQDVPTLRGQLRKLRGIADVIRDRIAVTKDITRKLNLEDQLLDVIRRIATTTKDIANQAAEAIRQKDQAIGAALSSKVGWASLTATLTDDLAALQGLARFLRAQIAAGKDVLANEQELLGVIGQIRDVRRQQAEAVQEARDTRQFLALGLGPGGSELIPTVPSLRKTFGTIKDAIRGTVLDTPTMRKTLRGIGRVLSGELGKIGSEMRATIDGTLDDITDSLNDFGDENGPATKFRKTSANAILRGLGLSPDETRALRGRLSQVGVGGTVPTRQLGAFGMAVPAGATAPTSFNLYIDGAPVEATVTRRQRTRKRRNPIQKRGPSVTGG